jgi:L-cysteate sulfo-lyase
MTMTASQLQTRIDALPRARLTQLPTPLEEVPRFAKEIGGDRAPRIFVKRDDLTGITGGGNKARVLEFFLGEAKAQGCDVLIAGGGVAQSNHARACGAAARRLGMKPVMVLRGGGDHHDDDAPQGNLLLDVALDVELHFVVPPSDGRFSLGDAMDEVAEDYRRRGHRPYVIKGSPTPPGPVGYVNAAIELTEQIEHVDWLFMPSTGGTQGGLMLGAEQLGLDWKVVGLSPSVTTVEAAREQVARVIGWTAERLGLTTAITPAAVLNEGGRYAGERYGKPTQAGLEALRLLAQSEGIMVDPVYNAKALSGMIDFVRSGRVGPNDTVVYVNTGGFPELFAYNREVAEYCRSVSGAHALA